MKQEELDQAREQETTEPVANVLSPGEIVIGVLTGINSQGQALVNFQDNLVASAIPAISTIEFSSRQIGRQVALLFAEGDLAKPVIMGLIHSALDAMLENFEVVVEEENKEENKEETANSDDNAKAPVIENVLLDGKRVVLEGKEEVVLKCGEASITLTKAGKILIRGKYLLNRSTGVNRIMGGSVQVN